MEEPRVIDALDDFIAQNVAFIDAYLARKAGKKMLGLITWNQKFQKTGL